MEEGNKYNDLIKKFEDEELENGTLTAEVYGQLLAAYMHENDFINANFIWKRIPQATKSGNKELERLQLLNVALNRNSPDAFKLITFEWSAGVKEIIDELETKIRQEILDLIGNAYSYIYENRMIEFTNLSSEGLLDSCKTLGWQTENIGQQKLILPRKNIVQKATATTSEEQLFILTDFVSFLEN